ncbi:PREDICTED: cytoplasmic polyadenylation element-binding protein 1 isoform X2 [Ceratosolen solmsi marchali]|uniref:Cytoplasmic polyadenylation element-binding protein 1 isoform X2 n=1 Tax=Ceratosolen solmsi marchali TaxID=326594 RepID=A0AAJ7DW48_9HYME|nr:PREDICTED: cytoplasmic polyadenylation element-binding protein 1 isoform X2 [Ceratosolen solmsi marchali]
MPISLQQLVYQYEGDKTATVAEPALESGILQNLDHKFMQQRQEREETMSGLALERDHAAQQRENKMQLQQHERDQHIQQLQSINSLLLDLPTPSSPNSYSSSKFSHDVTSPTTKDGPASLEDMSISDLFGLGLPRGSLMGAGQKEQEGQTNCDSPAYRYYHQQRDNSAGFYSKPSTIEHNNSSGYYSNTSKGDVPSSPISFHTPASPSTPGSLYSNSYSYSSVNSSPYTSASSVSNDYNKQSPSSPIRYPCYGRPIRGSTPYSDCSSPSVEFSPHPYNCTGSRSNSPADSENSVNSIESPLSDIMSYLSLNSGQHRCYPTDQNSLLEAEKYFQYGRATLELLKRKKYLNNSHLQQQQQPQTPMHHYHHHHTHGHTRNHHNQQHNSPYINPVFGSEKSCCLGNNRNVSIISLPNTAPPSHLSLDKAARYHRNAAAASDANYTWSGTLPQRTQKPVGYSSKVFLGGVPWDITESILISTFKQFGQIRIEWPGKDQTTSQPKGYVYIIFESEKQVKSLLTCCTHDFSNGGSYYYKISSKRMKGKQVQVIPWALNDSNYVKSSSQKLDPEKTVFVGALHGMMTAPGLAQVMNDLFDNVIYAGIDTDKHKYPIGSARVTFSNKYSFHKAVNAAFIEIKTTRFTKKVQVDPYIEDAPCSSCYVQQGPYFCRESSCFKYYCHTCWQWVHNNDSISWHKPMSRGLKTNQVIGLTPSVGAGRSTNLI